MALCPTRSLAFVGPVAVPIFIALLVGAALGAVAAWAARRRRILELERAHDRALSERDEREGAIRQLEPELAALRERLAVLGDVERQLEDRFKLLAGDVLSKSSASLADSARQIVEPLRQSLERVDRQAQELEQSRR